MRLNIQHFCVRSTDVLDRWVEGQVFSLRPRLQIDEANVRLECRPGTSPAFQVKVHLVTPGPDLFAEGRDHTLRAAFGKVMAELDGKIAGRARNRRQQIKSNRQSPAARSRTGRGRGQT